MANKTLGTRQKLGFRIEPSQKISKPRNPIAVAAKLRAAGPHRKKISGRRQLQQRALRKILSEPGHD
ncbi:MAG TPA: hypothetical protein DIT28_05480 [Oxalobacteraceae bacterium]|jgi:hypothetical protein|nr:hypothetical protein [Oxalobacteraceae bacterium]HCN88615.1 hypothetical protein [Oxalobacteraceae bacterium]